MSSQQTERNVLCSSLLPVSSEKYSVVNLTESDQVCNRSCILTDAVAFSRLTGLVIRPVSYSYIGYDLRDAERAYDSDWETFAWFDFEGDEWSEWLVFYLPPGKYYSRLRIYAEDEDGGELEAMLDYWNGDRWINFYDRDLGVDDYTYISFSEYTAFDKLRFKCRLATNDGIPARIYDIRLTQRTPMSITIYDGFNNKGRKIQQAFSFTTKRLALITNVSVLCDKGLYVEFEQSIGSIFLRYLIVKEKQWFTPQTSLPLLEVIPKTNRWQRLYRLLKDWFIK